MTPTPRSTLNPAPWHHAGYKKPSHSRGFTIIEIIIVVLIIAIMSSVAVTRLIGAGDARSMARTAGQWRTLIPTLRMRAILKPAILGVQIDDDHYRIFRLSTDLQQGTLHWEPLKNESLAGKQSFPRGVTVRITQGSQPASLLQLLAGEDQDDSSQKKSSASPQDKAGLPSGTKSNSSKTADSSSDNQAAPQIMLLPNGDISATELSIHGKKNVTPIHVWITAGGEVTLDDPKLIEDEKEEKPAAEITQSQKNNSQPDNNQTR